MVCSVLVSNRRRKTEADMQTGRSSKHLSKAQGCNFIHVVRRSAAAGVILRQGAALRRAAVAQWEVRLRVADRGGAWRIVVSIPTGALSSSGARYSCTHTT
jgi:hypothetical protein